MSKHFDITSWIFFFFFHLVFNISFPGIFRRPGTCSHHWSRTNSPDSGNRTPGKYFVNCEITNRTRVADIFLVDRLIAHSIHMNNDYCHFVGALIFRSVSHTPRRIGIWILSTIHTSVYAYASSLV